MLKLLMVFIVFNGILWFSAGVLVAVYFLVKNNVKLPDFLSQDIDFTELGKNLVGSVFPDKEEVAAKEKKRGGHESKRT